MPSHRPLGLFQGLGIELEYMIVDHDRLDVLPVSDVILRDQAGRVVSEVEFDDLAWSNELVLHVIELKTNGPAAGFDGLADRFQRDVKHINQLLAEHRGHLLPTGMHPWMNPFTQTRLWPHEYNAVYESFNRIFGCQGHGWANLQSLHLNLPFADDDEFGRLHAAIRLVLPILPALAASSPVMEGWITGLLDNRLEAYRVNCARIPLVTGEVIPEPVFCIRDYHDRILAPIYQALAPYDPEGVLREEWVNARGAIARFDRQTIEIRVIDVQECPAADLAVATAVVAVLKQLIGQRWSDLATQQAWPVAPLAAIFRSAIRDADAAVIDCDDYLRILGWTQGTPCTAGQLWRHLIEAVDPADLAGSGETLGTMIEHGPLARRILRALGAEPDEERLLTVYHQLGRHLAEGSLFIPD